MKKKFFTLLAVMLMTLAANAQTTQHDYVDLGLPSGTLWATTNVGGKAPESCGWESYRDYNCDYNSWGDPYDERYSFKLSEHDYKYFYFLTNTDDYYNITKYCTDSERGYQGFTDNLTELLPEDDDATVWWGSEWQTPSKEQFEELIDDRYTTTEWTTLNGVNGRRITSKSNGNSIFLPAGGIGLDDVFDDGSSFDVGPVRFDGESGYYWSRSLNTEYCSSAYCLYFTESEIKTDFWDRNFGLCIRPVRVKEPDPDPNEVYTEFVESTGTLTYYYDTQRDERTGVTELYDPIKYPDAVRFKDYYGKVLKIVIDPSMKNAHLTSTYSMFFGGVGQDPFGFYALENMTEIDGLENLNTSAVTDMESMFFGCYALTSLDLSSFNTSNVKNFNGMFMFCNKLKIIDVSSFDISKATDMRNMFGYCSELTTIYCDKDWSNTSANSEYMFSTSRKLVGGKGTAYDSNFLDATYARPDGGTEAPGYFTEKPTPQGDVNNDGTVDIADVVAVLNAMAGGTAQGNADVNNDTAVDIADVVAVLSIMAGK